MLLAELYDLVEADPTLEGVGLVPAKDGAGPALIIRHRPTGLLTRVGVDGIGRLEWAELEAVLAGRREPEVLVHMSRVVGYWSRVQNWNRSKIGELRDRQKGNYSIPAEA